MTFKRVRYIKRSKASSIGHEYVMTFKDSSVIISNDDEDAGDILENVDLQSNFKQRMKLKKQAEASGIGMRQDGSKMLP